MFEHSLQIKDIQLTEYTCSSLKKTGNRHYQHHQRRAGVFIFNLKQLSTLALVLLAVALWNL